MIQVLRVRHALTKLRVPRDDRIYVGVMGFQSEELGSDLDGRADALSLLLATDLNQAPEMIVRGRRALDRRGKCYCPRRRRARGRTRMVM